MNSTDGPIVPGSDMSVNSSNVAQAGSSGTHLDYYMDQTVDFIMDSTNDPVVPGSNMSVNSSNVAQAGSSGTHLDYYMHQTIGFIMDSTNDPVVPGSNMSVNSSDVAQAGSSDTYPDHYMFDYPELLEYTMGVGQTEPERCLDMPNIHSPPPEHNQQNMSSDGTIFPTPNFRNGLSNTESNLINLSQTSSDPWSSQFLRLREWNSGNTAFIDSPGSASDQSSCGTCPQSCISTREFAGNDARPSTTNHVTSLETDGNEYQQLNWEETFIKADGFPKISEMSKESKKQQRGGRTGPLPTQTAINAGKMRGSACWYCKTHKKKCSFQTPCEPCSKSLSPLEDRFCCRSIFKDFGSLYFPDILTAHLTQEKVEEFMREHVGSMPNSGLSVGVTCGRRFEPMQLTVHVFEPKTNELTFHHHLVPESDGEVLALKPCAPVGILGVDLIVLKNHCKLYIGSMVAEPEYPMLEAPYNSGALGQEIRYQALSIVHKYSKHAKDPMLDRALELHGMHYFMRTIIQFTDESAVTVARESKNLLGYYFEEYRYESSRLLGRQLKHAMHDVMKQQTKKLLENLERCLKKKEKDEWPRWFCVLLILCFATEDIQIAIDTFVVNDNVIDVNDSRVFDKSRQSYRDCWNLEDKLSHQFTQLFHDVYQTHKRCDGFNPLLNEKCSANWSQPTKVMLWEIRKLIEKFSYNMDKLSTLQVLDRNQFLFDNPSFIRDNPGRLVSKFLLSFRNRA